MVQVTFSRESLILVLEGHERFLALKREVRIPLRCIRAVSTSPVARRVWRGLRFPGTEVPGVFVAGTFYNRTGKSWAKTFYYMRHPAACVSLDLVGHEYDRVVFETRNKERVAATIRARRPWPPKVKRTPER